MSGHSTSIPTTQNVELQYQLASIGDRILATLIDWAVLFGYYIVISWVLVPILRAATGLAALAILFYMLPIFLYHPISEIFLNGQSIGKKTMQTKVIRIDGSEASLGNYLVRGVFQPVEILFTYGLVALLSILWGNKGQRLGDVAAGTTVIKIKPPVSLSTTIYSPAPPNYRLVFPEVHKLSEHDIHLAREVLTEYQNNFHFNLRKKLANEAYRAFSAKLDVKSDLPLNKFLETIIRDYNVIHSGLPGQNSIKKPS